MNTTILPTIDLTNCDLEPIHIPGSIQSHGFLICVQPGTFKVITVSENVELYLGKKPAAILGKPVTDCIEAVTGVLISELLNLGATTNFEAQNPTPVLINDQQFNLIVHIVAGGNLILEFEYLDAIPAPIPIQQTMTAALNRIQLATSSLQLFTFVVSLVQEITGYDRVMAYKFHPDGHGEVIAEEKKAGLQPFLHYHYPASDIPRQARELYKINLTRLIADIEAQVSDLVSLPGHEASPLDLSGSMLRAVSRVHIEYLRNMGVRSSFSISLIYKKELWGLIACHNYTLKPALDYNSRIACRFIGQLFSSSLEFRIEEDNRISLLRYLKAEQKIQYQLNQQTELTEALISGPVNILSVNSACGAMLFFDNKITTIGDTPGEAHLQILIDILRASNLSEIDSSTSIVSLLPEAHLFADTASGFLLAQISPGMKEFVLWFKPEMIHTINWAGDPNKPATLAEDGTARILPRRSFDQWQRQVRYTSADWTEAEIQSASVLREHIIVAQNTHARDVRTLNELLKNAYEELDTFTFTISHDLRTPLSSIRNYTELILEDYKAEIPPEVSLLLKKVVNRTEKMEQLIKDVLHYSKMSRTGIVMEKIKMTDLLFEVCDQVKSSSSRGASARISTADPIDVYADPTMAEQLFANIIGNAVKYTAPGVVPRVQIHAKPYETDYVLYTVKDNGVGFDMKHAENIFELFHRLDNTKNVDGTGIGLAIVKRIVERNRGLIWVESIPNEGTTFYICLLKELPKNKQHARADTGS